MTRDAERSNGGEEYEDSAETSFGPLGTAGTGLGGRERGHANLLIGRWREKLDGYLVAGGWWLVAGGWPATSSLAAL